MDSEKFQQIAMQLNQASRVSVQQAVQGSPSCATIVRQVLLTHVSVREHPLLRQHGLTCADDTIIVVLIEKIGWEPSFISAVKGQRA